MSENLRAPYRLESLPLDAADDDPRWGQFIDTLRGPLLAPRASAEGEKVFRTHRRADQARLSMVTAEGLGLPQRQPVAAFNCSDRQISLGRADVGMLTIATIGVRASHRRKGLLTALMTQELTAGRDRGLTVAALSASEATIYGRFGFAPVDQWRHIEVTSSKVVFKPGVEVARGHLEVVEPGTLREHIVRLAAAHRAAHVGSASPGEVDLIVTSGEFDPVAAGPATSLRALAHFSEEGELDGFATFTPKDSDTGAATATVSRVLAVSDAVERALWQGLASIDLIERLDHDQPNADASLDFALVDRRAVKCTSLEDHMWLRLLDLPRAIAARTFPNDGSCVLTVEDRLGFCAGSWRIDVTGGVGTATRLDTGDVRGATLDVSVLAGLWFGNTAPRTVVDAGLVRGDTAEFCSLFATSVGSRNLFWF